MTADAPPTLPVPLSGLVKYIDQHPQTPMTELLEPYRKYEAHVRQAFAQDADNELLKDPHVNVLPLFTEDTPSIKIRARKLESESKEEKSKYIMPLPASMRRPDGSPAVVQSLKDFQRNFNVFSESSLVDLDWSNVVAAGSAVVNCLLPVPEEYNGSKRALREFYHEKFCPASDVDLFLYGLTEEQAIEKLRDIETRVRDALLTESTVVRTKHAITICSQYPTRHVQIVLRIYKSVSEILTGFDIDCSGAAYDGSQVYCTPRALQSYMTQINHIDLSRRSPSYENRLSKYSKRGFEVYWSDLDRSRIDPTIFERSFQMTHGLARLLVLERLPTSSARDQYADQRRAERGRPPVNRSSRTLRSLFGNIKEHHEDEVADWFTEDEVSNYHTFSIPYGPRFNARKIERLCYTRDLLLNAEWNRPDDREVNLHRHPAFFGRFEDVIHDCCGYCPVPKTDEEKEIAEEEAKVFISGSISFIKDDPGRQEIGSFNPLTQDNWTEMAYLGDTAQLCQAIVDGDLARVTHWLSQEGANPNIRDHTGRAPLHLAVMCSTPDVVRALVDAGARLVARLADGRTALHLAATRGDVDIIKILLDKSAANEAEYEEKQDQRRQAKTAAAGKQGASADQADEGAEDSDIELVDVGQSEVEAHSTVSGSFVKVGKDDDVPMLDGLTLGDNEEEKDFFDINVLSWDMPCTALHFAILEGNVDAVRTLVQDYGADVLLPVNFLNDEKTPYAALLNLVLALSLPVAKAKEMVETLVSLGATSSQADMKGVTAFHRFAEENAETLLKRLWEIDPVGTQTVINHVATRDFSGSHTPLQVAVRLGNKTMVSGLLDHGALPHVDFETWLKSAKKSAVVRPYLRTLEENKRRYNQLVDQPLILALESRKPEIALELLDRGADPNVITTESHHYLFASSYSRCPGESALDLVNKHLESLRAYDPEFGAPVRPRMPGKLDASLANFEEGTYQHWVVSKEIGKRRMQFRKDLKAFKKARAAFHSRPGFAEKAAAIEDAIKTMEKIKEALLAKGAKTFAEMYHKSKPKVQVKVQAIRTGQTERVTEKTKSFQVTFSFHNVNDVTEAREAAYFKLFEAAWKGDLETVKTLTLTSWDDANEEAPLKIAVHDQDSNNPFSLAFSRGHYDVARAVLEIARAQYAPAEKPKTRYWMETEDSDDESTCSDDSGPRIYSTIVGRQSTIDDIGQVSMKVQSRTKPQAMIGWTNPLRDVITKNDMQGLKFLLDMFELYSAQKLDPDDQVSDFYYFPDNEFKLAVQLGRVELLREIIRRTGAGLPLKQLVRKTGLELKEKPEYYQGLTVYGKKRRDWAAEGSSWAEGPSGTEVSPLLLAALAGRVESVEWFLSDTPLRLYLTFANSKAARKDARLRHLAQAPGGFDRAISRWLNEQSELVLHAAIVAPPSKNATGLVAYLVRTQRALLEVRAANGETPLMLACRLGRLDVVKILVDAGADQTTKDRWRNNLLHSALQSVPSAAKLESLLGLLDREAVIPMLKERNKLQCAGRTPLHQYLGEKGISGNGLSPVVAIRVFKQLVGISPETARKALKMLDGAGDTPLHTLLAKNADPTLIRTVIEFDTSLLFCENAVGRTPADVAHDRYLSDRVNSRTRNAPGKDPVSRLVKADPRAFVKKDRDGCDSPNEHEPRNIVAMNWRVCSEIMSRIQQPKRTLVSLNSANFVAKRLGDKYTNERYAFRVAECEEESSTSSGSQNGDADEERTRDAAMAAPLPKEKSRRRRSDIISNRSENDRAWESHESSTEEDDDDDESDAAEKEGKDDAADEEDAMSLEE